MRAVGHLNFHRDVDQRNVDHRVAKLLPGCRCLCSSSVLVVPMHAVSPMAIASLESMEHFHSDGDVISVIYHFLTSYCSHQMNFLSAN